MNYSTTGEQCIYVTGHREEHRFAEPGEGDLSDAIRLRVAIDVREDEIEQLITERDALRAVLVSIREDFDTAVAAHDIRDPRHRSHGGQHTNGRCCPFGTVNPTTITEFKRMVATIDAALGKEGAP